MVRKVSVGAIRDFRVSEHVKVGVGAQVSAFDVEEPLASAQLSGLDQRVDDLVRRLVAKGVVAP